MGNFSRIFEDGIVDDREMKEVRADPHFAGDNEFLSQLAENGGYDPMNKRIKWLSSYMHAEPSWKVWRRNYDSAKRIKFIEELGNFRGLRDSNSLKEAIESLRKALGDGDKEVRRKAVWALGELGNVAKEAVPEIIKVFEAEDFKIESETFGTDIELYRGALVGIGDIEGLTKGLGSFNTGVRRLCITAIFYRPFKVPTNSFVQALYDNDPDVRFYAAFLLYERTDATGSVPRLIELAQDEKEPARFRAALAAGSLGCKEAIPLIIEYFDGQSFYNQSEAMSVLEKLDAKGIIPSGLIINWLRNEDAYFFCREEEKGCSISASAKLGDGDSISLVCGLMGNRSENNQVRYMAIKFAGYHGGKDAIAALTKLAMDKKEDYQIRYRALEALSKMRTKETITMSMKIVGDKKEQHEMRGEAALLLCEMKAQEAIPLLTQVMAEPSMSDYFQGLFYELSNNGIEPSSAMKERVVGEGDYLALFGVVKDATKYYKWFDVEVVTTKIVEIIKKDDGYLGIEHIKYLCENGKGDVAIELAKDRSLSDFTRVFIIRYLYFLKERAIPTLMEFLEDSDLDLALRSAAASALGEMKDKGIIPRLKSVRGKNVPLQVKWAIDGAIKELSKD